MGDFRVVRSIRLKQIKFAIIFCSFGGFLCQKVKLEDSGILKSPSGCNFHNKLKQICAKDTKRSQASSVLTNKIPKLMLHLELIEILAKLSVFVHSDKSFQFQQNNKILYQLIAIKKSFPGASKKKVINHSFCFVSSFSIFLKRRVTRKESYNVTLYIH